MSPAVINNICVIYNAALALFALTLITVKSQEIREGQRMKEESGKGLSQGK